jgi:F-type H+-transporting ATPase subunit delta
VAVIEQITARAGLSAIVSRLLGLLASRDRLELLAGLLEEYRRRVLDHERVVRAEVTAAVPLDDRQMAALGQAFARVTGRQVQVTAEVDAAVVGGVVVRIGSTVYDGSVRRHLERLRETLAGGI